MLLNLQAVQNRNGLRTVSHARIPLVKPLGFELAALAVGVSKGTNPGLSKRLGSLYLF
ncbi:hypothetical protein J2Z64_003858 [Oceanobacillus polygoni]|uniref:Uncharacterized protein n=1 Tax=Oceanobacillus polygoni TaxID=1235259 RepID=A0A9X0Z0J4_9BACI|nr:hypothetical protein [Oceanobacillus polygoni]